MFWKVECISFTVRFSSFSKVSYSKSHTAATFRKCDSRNLNLSPFCQLLPGEDPTDGGLQRWLADLIPAYDDIGEQIPFYLEGSGGKRAEYPGNLAESELLEGLKKENATYDAFARDIAVLNIYFGEPEFPGESEQETYQKLIVFITTQIMRKLKGWPGLGFSPMWEDFAVFVLGSASYQALRLSTGSSSGLPGLSVIRNKVVARSKQKHEEGKTFGFAADLRNIRKNLLHIMIFQ